MLNRIINHTLSTLHWCWAADGAVVAEAVESEVVGSQGLQVAYGHLQALQRPMAKSC